jgi:hypothetical protein
LESFGDQRSGVMFLLFHGNFVLLDMKTAATSMTCLGGETGIRYKVERVLATSEISVANSVQFLDLFLSFGCVHFWIYFYLLLRPFIRPCPLWFHLFFFLQILFIFLFCFGFFPVRPFIHYGEFFSQSKKNKYNIL